MYELFEKLSKFRSKPNDYISNELYLTVPNEKLIKYLTTFKTDICLCLDESKFFEKNLDSIVVEEAVDKKKNRDKDKEKGNKWIPHEEELG